tara:strand:+ start:4084 stop:4368 length:285 start_codon:yes stop_codon:yes gene_type:complete
MKNYSIRLKDDQVKQLNKVADDQQRDISFIIRAAIDSYLNIAPVMIKDKPTISESKPVKQPIQRKAIQQAIKSSADGVNKSMYKDAQGVWQTRA